GEVARFKNEPAGSNFNFVNVAGWFIGPPWTSSTPAWNDTRITAFAYPVPKLNSPPMLNIGGGVPPCIASTDPRVSRPPNWVTACPPLGQLDFRSPHPGRATFVFGDGSVKFIKDTISLPIYRSLGTRSMGEVISADAF